MPEPLSEEKLGSKKVCEVCGRERLNGLARAADSDRYCDTASDVGYESSRCWRLGYERLSAILTPEVLRLREAGRQYRRVQWWGTQENVLNAALALPFEKPAESNHTEKQQLPKKGGE